MIDVAIIGAGPAGLHLATRLGQAGFQVQVLDDRPAVGYRKICSGIIGREAFDRFDLPNDLVVSQIQNLVFHAPNGTTVSYQHPEVLASVVDRPAFDARLADRARGAGVAIRVSNRVLSLEVTDSYVSLRVRDRHQPDRCLSVQARFAVVATGVNARLNRAAGLGEPVELVHAAQAHIRTGEIDETHCFAGRQLAPGGFGWLVPVKPGWGRIGIMAQSRVQKKIRALLERVDSFRTSPDEPVRISYKPIAQSFSGPSFNDRILAVGEAAGQVKTTTGGGIYYGLLAAEVACETLSAALHSGRSRKEHLAEYETAWRGRIQGEIDTGFLYRKLFARLSDRKINTLFRLASSNGILPLVRETARFDWHSDVLGRVATYSLVPSILGIRRKAG